LKMVVNLLASSRILDLQYLSSLCENSILARCNSNENAVEILECSETHSLNRIYDWAIWYVIQYFSEFSQEQLNRLSSAVQKRISDQQMKFTLSPPPARIELPERSLGEDILTLFELQKSDADFTLDLDSVNFDEDQQAVEPIRLAIHKCILVARSPFFDRLLRGNFREQAQRQLTHTLHMPFDSFSALFRYLFSGNLDIIDNFFDALWILAEGDFYLPELPFLEEHCRQVVANELSVENSIELLRITETSHNGKLEELRTQALRILANEKEKLKNIFHSQGEEHTYNEILQKFQELGL